ncbi:S8 family serine peptidase [Robiginitalea sp. M366]|uniref:S8 family serine peptidase n=1 Tax=Robiginitalea aestuariiviva TaxID=3036903 RepID=UPI00240E938C|nr:S8 family serine peptidase [Robiginitalea aestuariiviva]MDG1570965.1 S8 family serine peptidase [Robiginitalea aestuariiviva]
MRKTLRTGLGISAMAALAFMASCENGGNDAVFETLENQNALLVELNYQVIPGQYVVTFEPGTLNSPKTSKGATAYKGVLQTSKNQILSEFSKAALSAEAIEAVYAYSVEGFSGRLTDEQLVTLSNDPRVKSIEQDYLIILAPPPGKGPGGGGGGTATEEIPYGITRVGGGQTYTGTGKAYILDTGIDLDHEDLNVDAGAGFNAFTSGKDGRDLDDGNGHGTHVAGTVAAIDNEVGVVGVAAGATVVPVKVLGARGSGSYSGVISGVDFVGASAGNGDVANMSLGGPISTALDAAVEAAAQGGVKFALAAGNESDDANNHSPARANGNNIYTVSAMDSNDNFASFSNYGNPPVDYCAPGVAIKSTWKDGGYNTISGTSMASPHVCGLLLWGNIQTSGTVNGDPDGNADPIASR